MSDSGVLSDDIHVAVLGPVQIAGHGDTTVLSGTNPPALRAGSPPVASGRTGVAGSVLNNVFNTEPRVAILGTVELTGGGRSTSLPGTNLPALLSMLALTPGRPLANDRIIDALWPDADPIRGRRSLISLVHKLNATLGTHLGADKAVTSVKSVGRALRIDPATIDIVRFDRQLAEADDLVDAGRLDDAVDVYESALALWRGEPFGGLDLPYFFEPSARLRIARHRGETALIDASLRTGRGAALVPWLLQRVAADPMDEQAAADATRALYHAGRSGDALRVLRRSMDEQRSHGIEPNPATRRLELDVLDHTLDRGIERPVRDGRIVGRSVRHTADLIGRQAERAVLDAWYSNPAEATVMVISGEAGIGKTAMLDAWLGTIDDDRIVVRTRCSPEQILPFEAFAGLLGDVPDDLGDRADAAERVFPTSRHLLFDEVVRRLVAQPAPVRLLAIDDAQWLTVASVALLRHVLGHRDVGQLGIVLTVRSPDASANTALAQLLDDLQREGGLCTVHLGPFRPAELDELIARQDMSSPSVNGAQLLRLTGGNPLFAIHMLRTGANHDELDLVAVPPTVESMLGRYLRPLTPAVLRIVETAALLGAEGDPTRLAACAGATELEAMDALDEVGGGRLMHVEPIGGAYRFVHDLARRTVTSAIGAARAAHMHVHIAEVLESEQRPDAFAVAHHLSVGRDAAPAPRVVKAIMHAARRARDMIDCEGSESLAQAVLELSDDPVDRADALILLANAAQMRGDRQAVERHIADAQALAAQSDTPAVLVRTVHVMADHHRRGSNAELVALIERAYERVKQAGTPGELIEAVWALCRERRYERPELLIDIADGALAMARDLPTHASLLQALHARIIVGQAALEDLDRVTDWCKEGVALARRERNPMMLALLQGATAHTLMQCGRFDAALAVQTELDRAADASNSPIFRWNTDVRNASFLLVQDRLDEAAAAIDLAGTSGAELGDARPAEEFATQIGVLHMARDQFADIRQLLQIHAANKQETIWHWAVALAEAADGDVDAASERYSAFEWPAHSAAPPHWLWLPELTIAAEVALRCDDPELGRDIVQRIQPYCRHHAVFGVTLSLGSMYRPYAFALAAAGRRGEAHAALVLARRSNADAGLAMWVRLCGEERLVRARMAG